MPCGAAWTAWTITRRAGRPSSWTTRAARSRRPAEVFDDLQEFQLPCYLLAVEHGLTEAPRERRGLRAGYIGLKVHPGEAPEA